MMPYLFANLQRQRLTVDNVQYKRYIIKSIQALNTSIAYHLSVRDHLVRTYLPYVFACAKNTSASLYQRCIKIKCTHHRKYHFAQIDIITCQNISTELSKILQRQKMNLYGQPKPDFAYKENMIAFQLRNMTINETENVTRMNSYVCII